MRLNLNQSMASYEEQAYYIYELIENLDDGDSSTTRIIFDTFNLNKTLIDFTEIPENIVKKFYEFYNISIL